MEEKHFQIKNYPDDIYRAVGELIRWAQEWEEQFKKFAKLLRVNKINIDIASLNVLTAARSEFFGPRHDFISATERRYIVTRSSTKGSVTTERMVPVENAAAENCFSPSSFSANATTLAAGGIAMAITGVKST